MTTLKNYYSFTHRETSKPYMIIAPNAFQALMAAENWVGEENIIYFGEAQQDEIDEVAEENPCWEVSEILFVSN